MSDLKRCPTCNGSKRTMGMGMMEHKCKECSGIGFIAVDIAKDVPRETLNTSANENVITPKRRNVTTSKRRGRKPKHAVAA